MIKEILTYGIIGLLSLGNQTLIYLNLIKVNVNPVIAIITGTLAGMVSSYIGHTLFTFKKRFKLKDFLKFLVTSQTGLLLNFLSVFTLTHILKLNPKLGVIPTLVTPLITFLMSKYWTFK